MNRTGRDEHNRTSRSRTEQDEQDRTIRAQQDKPQQDRKGRAQVSRSDDLDLDLVTAFNSICLFGIGHVGVDF
jgi:hypothetical protein